MNIDQVTIIKNDHEGNETWRYDGSIIKQSDQGILAQAYFNRSDLEFNGILLKEEDRFLELYLFGKWFNIFEIHDRDEKFIKAWYCNVTRPVRFRDSLVFYDDLALDLLVYPDGKQLSLDYEDFVQLDLPEDEKKKALAGLEELKALFSRSGTVSVHDLV